MNTARADDDGEQGGDIEGTESLDVELSMTPTAAAPAGSSIELSFEAEDEDGTTQATLQLETEGLPAGTYSVSVTLKSNGSTVALGTFTVDAEGEGEIEFGGDDAPFPTNFNPFDIATVSVADSNNVVLFTADLTSVSSSTSMNLSASVLAQAGPMVPNATGSASLTAFVSRGKPKGSVQITGQGLPPNTTLTVAVNGTSAKKTKSGNTGNISVLLKPKGKTGTVATGVGLFGVTSVTVHDKSGNVLLSVNF